MEKMEKMASMKKMSTMKSKDLKTMPVSMMIIAIAVISASMVKVAENRNVNARRLLSLCINRKQRVTNQKNHLCTQSMKSSHLHHALICYSSKIHQRS